MSGSLKLKCDVTWALVRQQEERNTNPKLRSAMSIFSAGSHPPPGTKSSSLGHKATVRHENQFVILRFEVHLTSSRRPCDGLVGAKRDL